MHVRVVMQARTDSSRLPGKALLPLMGMPSAVLAAKRAGNRGHDVVLATTDRSIDDQLAEAAANAGLRVFRGETDDVRKRFLDAAGDLDDDDIIVRLTADNMVPDGDLVARAVEALDRTGSLLIRSMADHRLPHGLAVEALKAGSLRVSVGWRDDPFAREHVTPAIIERVGELPAFIDLDADLGHHRCTMDTFEDYLLVQALFESTDDAVHVGWEELISRLVTRPDAPPPRALGPGLIVGTAQLAMPYGTVRKTLPPSRTEARSIVLRAVRSGYGIDTAPAYGHAEEVIGQALRGGAGTDVHLTTKLDVNVAADTSSECAELLRAEVSVLRSRLSLQGVVPDVLAHRPEQRTALNGAVWDALKQLQAEGVVARLGVSVYTPGQALAALNDPTVGILQLPFNLLDRRWVRAGVVAAVAQRNDVVVHTRSTFLQGILLQPPDAWPRLPGFAPSWLRARMLDVARDLGRTSAADLCVAYVRGHGLHNAWIHGVFIGTESMQQLRENEILFGQPALSRDELRHVDETLSHVPEQLLDPSTWPPESS